MRSEPVFIRQWERLLRPQCMLPVLLVVLSVGCSNQTMDHRYRYVNEWQQLASHSGLGVHQRIWEQYGAKCYAPLRLSHRLKNVDVIVLAASTFDPPGQEARQWLRNAPGRKVIYFGRDFDASTFYYQRVLDQLKPEQQELVNQKITQLQIAELQDRLASYSENTFCEWFYLQTDQEPVEIGQLAGPWATKLPQSARELSSKPDRDMLSKDDSDIVPEVTSITETADAGYARKPEVLWPLRTRMLPPSHPVG